MTEVVAMGAGGAELLPPLGRTMFAGKKVEQGGRIYRYIKKTVPLIYGGEAVIILTTAFFK